MARMVEPTIQPFETQEYWFHKVPWDIHPRPYLYEDIARRQAEAYGGYVTHGWMSDQQVSLSERPRD